MADKRCTQHKNNVSLILIYIFFLCLALAAGLVALFTDNWVTYEVNENNKTSVYNASADSSMLYHTRTRGLFWIVIKNPNVKLVKDRGNDARFPVQYNQNKTCGLNVSVGFWNLHDMMKASVSLHLVYLVITGISAWFAGFAFIFGICNLKLSVIVLVLGEVSGIIGMAMFHYYLMFEKTKDVPEMADTVYYFWNDYLKSNTKEYFSYSFMLQWISIGITLITILLGIIFIVSWKVPKPKLYKQPDQTHPINYVNAHDNFAYDKDDYLRGGPRGHEYRPSPGLERRGPIPDRRGRSLERREPQLERREPPREPSPSPTPVRRSWAMNGPDYEDQARRRPAEETRYEYREVLRDDRRDQGRDRDVSRLYPLQGDPFYPRY